jgi:hypothetical protein
VQIEVDPSQCFDDHALEAVDLGQASGREHDRSGFDDFVGEFRS